MGFSSCSTRALEHRFSSCAWAFCCRVVCGIFPDQEWNRCLLHWQEDSLPPSHQGNPRDQFLMTKPSVQFSSSVVSDSATPWTAAHQASLSITNSQSLFKLMSIELRVLSKHLILCHPLLLPSIFPSIRVFSNESVHCIRWPKYWSFSLSISPSIYYSGLISFRMDWFDLHAV